MSGLITNVSNNLKAFQNLDANASFVLNRSGSGIKKAGFWHKVAVFFGGGQSANRATIDHIKNVLINDPTYAPVTNTINALFADIRARGGEVSGAFLGNVMSQINMEANLAKMRSAVTNHLALALNDEAFRDHPALAAMKEKFDAMGDIGGMVKDFALAVKKQAIVKFLECVRTDGTVRFGDCATLIDETIASLAKDAMSAYEHGTDALSDIIQHVDISEQNLESVRQDALRRFISRTIDTSNVDVSIDAAAQRIRDAETGGNAGEARFVVTLPDAVANHEKVRRLGIPKDALAKVYTYERQLGMSDEQFLHELSANGAGGHSPVVWMAFNPQLLATRSSYVANRDKIGANATPHPRKWGQAQADRNKSALYNWVASEPSLRIANANVASKLNLPKNSKAYMAVLDQLALLTSKTSFDVYKKSLGNASAFYLGNDYPQDVEHPGKTLPEPEIDLNDFAEAKRIPQKLLTAIATKLKTETGGDPTAHADVQEMFVTRVFSQATLDDLREKSGKDDGTMAQLLDRCWQEAENICNTVPPNRREAWRTQINSHKNDSIDKRPLDAEEIQLVNDMVTHFETFSQNVRNNHGISGADMLDLFEHSIMGNRNLTAQQREKADGLTDIAFAIVKGMGLAKDGDVAFKDYMKTSWKAQYNHVIDQFENNLGDADLERIRNTVDNHAITQEDLPAYRALRDKMLRLTSSLNLINTFFVDMVSPLADTDPIDVEAAEQCEDLRSPLSANPAFDLGRNPKVEYGDRQLNFFVAYEIAQKMDDLIKSAEGPSVQQTA